MATNRAQGRTVGAILGVTSLALAVTSASQFDSTIGTLTVVYDGVITLNLAAFAVAHVVPGWDATVSFRHPGYLPVVAGWTVYVATSLWYVAHGQLELVVFAHLGLAVLAPVGLLAIRQFGADTNHGVT